MRDGLRDPTIRPRVGGSNGAAWDAVLLDSVEVHVTEAVGALLRTRIVAAIGQAADRDPELLPATIERRRSR
jgi:hypothetical protein